MLKKYFLIGLFLCMMMCSCFENKKKEEAAHDVPQDTASIDTLPRSNITFILGKDENGRNPYYSLADQYYRLNDSEKTEIVIDTIFTWLQMRNYLSEHRPTNGRPWGLINLVAHGNEFIDLGVLTSPTGSRVSEKSLQKAIADSTLQPLDSLTIDKKTVFNLHGCAVGKNTGLLNLLGTALGGTANPAYVKASKMFEYYSYVSQDKNPRMIRHYYAQVWYAYYKADSFPDETALITQLKTRYPDDTINWTDAIHRQYPSNPSEAYHFNLKIPVVWEDFYESKDSLPDLNTRAKQLKWLKGKTEFIDLLKKTRIPQEYFNIKFYMLIYNKENEAVFSNKVKGMAGVICIVKPLLSKDASQSREYVPFIPSVNDSLYFGFAGFLAPGVTNIKQVRTLSSLKTK